MSHEEKLQIAQHFLISSPPGQFDSVLADVKKLLPDSLLTPPMLSGIAKAYNERHSSIVSVDGGESNIVICKVSESVFPFHNNPPPALNPTPLHPPPSLSYQEGEIDPTKYVNTVTKKLIKVNHTTRTGKTDSTKPLPPTTFDSSVESKRLAIQTEVQNYLSKHFSGGVTALGVYSSNKKITVVISGEKLNLKNYWSGSWVSKWTVTTNNEVSGNSKIIAHYFEEGNVQLNTTKTFPEFKCEGGSDESLAKSVATKIGECEQALQLGLYQMYGAMSEETLKSMRRVLPVTRTKMEWNSAAHKMTKQLTNNPVK